MKYIHVDNEGLSPEKPGTCEFSAGNDVFARQHVEVQCHPGGKLFREVLPSEESWRDEKIKEERKKQSRK